ncbi:MAG: MFS transporter [Chloroflexi bacterium]|nr:MFS transporter [Chloroflexota bacterium]
MPAAPKSVYTAATAAQGGVIDRRILLALLGFLVLIVVANNSSGSLAQPAIADAFEAGPADVGWVVFGYSATFAVATAVWGGLAARFGIGPSIATGVAIFACGSLLAAVAPSLPLLIGARGIQGLGSGAIPTLSAALIAGRFPGPERAAALGVTVAAVGTGLALGPLLGGAALEFLGWRAAVAFGMVAAPAALALWGRGEGETLPQEGRRGVPESPAVGLDVAGAAWVSVAVLAATFLLNRFVLIGVAPLSVIAAVVLAIAVVAIAQRAVKRSDAFLPRRILLDPVFQRVSVLGALGMSTFFGTLVSIPVAVSTAHGLTGISLGFVLLPMALVAAATSLNNARVQGRLNSRRTTMLALTSLAAGGLGLALAGPGAPVMVLAALLAPIGFGFGLLGPPLLSELTVRFAGRDRPLAVGAYNLVFFLGGSFGAAVASAFVGAQLELTPFTGRPVPGFSTVELLLGAVAGLAALTILLRARTAGPEPAESAPG